ncbi:MAG TPA: TolC family protein, partial [Terriglobales bacterium]|nr:TolC family protein [Terriglobales bacterium]
MNTYRRLDPVKPRWSLTALLALIVSTTPSCSVGPDYSRPPVTTPATYKEADSAATAQSMDDVIKAKWWEMFGDPELNALEEQVDLSNQNIAQADARYRQARALVVSARAAYYPTVTIGVGVTGVQSSPTTTPVKGPVQDKPPFTEHSLPIDVSWEIDVWGRIRRTVESGEANAQASAADLEAARLSARAQLAQAYFLLRTVDAQKQLLDATVVDYQKSLELTTNRYNSGVASRGDVL